MDDTRDERQTKLREVDEMQGFRDKGKKTRDKG